MGKQYTVFDGKLMLILEEAEEGGFVVTSPLDPGLVTQAETIQEAFLMAYDAAEGLAVARKKLSEQLEKALEPRKRSRVVKS
jgi:predicted RNase H-like HicB family nuclease